MGSNMFDDWDRRNAMEVEFGRGVGQMRAYFRVFQPGDTVDNIIDIDRGLCQRWMREGGNQIRMRSRFSDAIPAQWLVGTSMDYPEKIMRWMRRERAWKTYKGEFLTS